MKKKYVTKIISEHNGGTSSVIVCVIIKSIFRSLVLDSAMLRRTCNCLYTFSIASYAIVKLSALNRKHAFLICTGRIIA